MINSSLRSSLSLGIKIQPIGFTVNKKAQPTLNSKQNPLLSIFAKPTFLGYYFEFKKIEGLSCPCCGNIMTTNKEINLFAEEMKEATGTKIISGLEKYKDRLPEIERNVAIRIMDAAKEHENLKLNELLEEILTEPKQALQCRQRQILKEIACMSENLTGETFDKIQNDIKTVDIIIKEGINSNPFKRKRLIQGMEKLRDNENNTNNRKILEEIVKKAEEMPSSSSDINAFIVKYSRRTPFEIAYRILEPSVSTAEHIKPHSKFGHDGPDNYLAECKRCNNNRGNMSYVEWIKAHPEMITNVQKYMDKVIDKIIGNSIKGYDYYPRAVKTAILEESGRLINLDISRMDEFKKGKYRQAHQKPASSTPGLNIVA